MVLVLVPVVKVTVYLQNISDAAVMNNVYSECKKKWQKLSVIFYWLVNKLQTNINIMNLKFFQKIILLVQQLERLHCYWYSPLIFTDIMKYLHTHVYLFVY